MLVLENERSGVGSMQKATQFPTFTPAEQLVAVHVVEGLSNKEIAAILGKAEPTVKHQISALLSKAGVHSRVRFVARYYQQFFCPLLPVIKGNSPRGNRTGNPPSLKRTCADMRFPGGAAAGPE